MRVRLTETAQEFDLDGPPLGSGGEAIVFAVPNEPNRVAKIYHKPTFEHADKLAVMLAAPPLDPMGHTNHVSIAWPTARLFAAEDASRFAGFLMPRIDGASGINEYYVPKSRQQTCPLFHYGYLMRTARNLAVAVRALHDKGYVIGDLSGANLLVTNQALVSLVDTDSFQVRSGERVFRCRVGTPEYTPRELQNVRFAEMDRGPEHDNFGLAILIFRLLMQGTHPFAGIFTEEGEPASIPIRIARGHWPYARSKAVPFKPSPHAPPFASLPPQIQELMVRCFEEGHLTPETRPNARDWQHALQEAEKELKVCPANSQHYAHQSLSDCPWCALTKQQGRDPFPSVEALRFSKSKNGTRVILGAATLEEIPSVLPADPPVAGAQKILNVLPADPPASASKVLQNLKTTLVREGASLGPFLRRQMKAIWPYVKMVLIWIGLALLGIIAIALTIWISWKLSHRSLPVRDKESPAHPSEASSKHGDKAPDDGPEPRDHAPPEKEKAPTKEDPPLRLATRSPLDRLEPQRFPADAKAPPNTVAILEGMGRNPLSIAFSADGRALAAGGEDNRVHIWNLETMRESTLPTVAQGAMSAVAFRPGSRQLVSVSHDGQLRLWKLDEPTALLGSWEADRLEADTLALSPDGLMLATGGSDPHVRLWSFRQGKPVPDASLEGHQGAIFALAFGKQGKVLASAGRDTTVRFWDLSAVRPTAAGTGTAHTDHVLALAFAPDGQTLASAGRDRQVVLWRLRGTERREVVPLKQHTDDVTTVAFSPDGELLASAGQDGQVILWNVAGRKMVRSWQLSGPVRSVVFSPEGRHLAIARSNGQVIILRPPSER